MTESVDQTRPRLSRRALIGGTAAAGVGITLTGALDSVFGSGPAEAASERHGGHRGVPGYGPLVDDPAGRLALPAGFSYQLIAQSGVTLLDSGEPTPDRPDGTASFPRRGGGSVLVNNHEINAPGGSPVPHGDESLVYDSGANGGTTTLEVDRHGNRLGEYVSLAGTHNNCAGGSTPWRTWLTCEETEDVGPTNGLTKRHGYVFEVDPYDAAANIEPQPIMALGRYAHEAVVVDPHKHQLYLTEDAGNPNGLLYRYTPPRDAMPLGHGALRSLGPTDGDLHAMKAFDFTGAFVPDLSPAQVGTVYDVEWVSVPDRDAVGTSTRKQFNYAAVPDAPGGDITRSRKLEGAWWGHHGVFFVSSFARNSDGSRAQHDGQVWYLDPVRQRLTLTLAFAYTPGDQDTDPDGPDNITVSPYGGVILAEDGEGKQHLVGADHRGRAFFFARNDLPGSEEFTGPNFSADRSLLFANVQVPGHVYAIKGPFRKH